MDVLGTMQNNMPELPEVETIKNTLKNLIQGKSIEQVKVLREKNLNVKSSLFEQTLKNKTILDFERIGKFLIFKFDMDVVLVTHLRMEGKFYLRNFDESIEKHDIAIFYFKDKTYLAYNDTRKFGYLGLFDEHNYKNSQPLINVGPDPFMMNDATRLIEGFKNKSIPIKQALLDQSIMSGLGNIYVDEVLYKCELSPLTPAKMIDEETLTKIWKTSKQVMQKAINAGGSTIKSYHPAKGVSGNFQVQLEVYGKEGQKCPKCGSIFQKTFVNKRGTTFCPKCQKNINSPYIIALTGAICSGKSFVGEYLKQKGFIRFDTDQIVHSLYENEIEISHLKNIIPSLRIENGKVDREYLKDFLLKNPKTKIRLEKYIWKRIKDILLTSISKLSKQDKVVIEVPFLFASGLDSYADDIYIIEVSPAIQKERLTKRNKDVESYLALNKSYIAQEDKKKATSIINNDLDIASLIKLVDKTIFYK